MQDFTPQEVTKTETGEPVIGFLIKAQDLEALEAKLERIAQGEYVLAIKEEADEMLRIAVIVANPNPPPGLVENIQEEVEEFAQDQDSVGRYSSTQYDPTTVSFTTPEEKTD